MSRRLAGVLAVSVSIVVLVVVGLAFLVGCRDSPEEQRPQREQRYIGEMVVSGLDLIHRSYTNNANAFYFGPSAFDPAIVSGPGLVLSIPPKVGGGEDQFKETVATGKGTSYDGVDCFVVVDKSRPGGPQHSYWELTDAQLEKVRSGTHVVVEIDVVCGAPR